MKKPRKVPTKRPDTPARVAQAYGDAVRDILVADGLFHLGDERRGDTIWQWDGLAWRRLTLDDSVAELPLPETIEALDDGWDDGDVAAYG